MFRVRRSVAGLTRDLRRPNAEKVAFILAAAWLMVMWIDYADAPKIAEPGPARTRAVDTDVPQVSLGPPEPLDLSGDDPFRLWSDLGRSGGRATGGRDASGRGNADERADQRKHTGRKQALDDVRTGAGDGKSVHLLEPVPRIDFRGSVALERCGRWFVFENRSTERYHAAREGEAICELGLRLVGVEDRTPVVERTSPRED